jgi:hypothetical protein
MASSFTYKPLSPDSIRLLRFTGSPEDLTSSRPITCALDHVRRSSPPSFTALSYTWGPGADETILIDGEPCNIGPNAEQALRQLFADPAHGSIWIDQICINQSDDAEKSHQVQNMRQVYAAATRVAAWLGPEADGSTALCRHLGRLQPLLEPDVEDIDAVFAIHEDEEIMAVIRPAWVSFCQRAYWTRLWVIQEYAAARELAIHIGPASMSAEAVRRILLFVDKKLQPGRLDGSTVPAKYHLAAQGIVEMYKTPPTSFAEGVLTRRERYQQRDRDAKDDYLFRVLVTTLVLQVDYNSPKATDDRDRVFAVLQMADDADEFAGFPDYSMPCEQVYEATALTMLRQGHVDVLSYSQFPKKLQGLPSWVPDWSMQVRMPSCHVPWINNFTASWAPVKPPAALAIKSVKPGVVSIPGFKVDTIKELGSLWDPNWLAPVEAAAALQFLVDIEEFCRKSERTKRGVSGEKDFDVAKSDAARIAIVDLRGKNGNSLSWAEFCPVLQERAKDILREQLASGKDTTADSLALYQDVYIRLLKQLHTRRPFITTTGYVGICPSHAEPGDGICIFQGSKIAYVLRATQGEAYRMVGEAYVHGVMYGELARGTVELKDFILV